MIRGLRRGRVTSYKLTEADAERLESKEPRSVLSLSLREGERERGTFNIVKYEPRWMITTIRGPSV